MRQSELCLKYTLHLYYKKLLSTHTACSMLVFMGSLSTNVFWSENEMYKCKDVTLRVKECKAIALKRSFPGQSIIQFLPNDHRSRYGKNVKWDFVSIDICTVPSLAAILSIKLALCSSVHSGTLVRADRHPRPREIQHDRHPRHHAKL